MGPPWRFEQGGGAGAILRRQARRGGDVVCAVLSVRKASHRRASSDLRRDGRCELTQAFACASTAPMPPTPAIATGYDEKSACVKRLTLGPRTMCQSSHQLIT